MAAATDDPNIYQLSDKPSGVEDTDDGGAIVQMGKTANEPTADNDDFYCNLAETIDLNNLALDLIQRVDFDRKSREKRTAKYEEGIKRTGLGDEAPGAPAFEGASTAVHPMMSKATIYYQAHTIGELMPPAGPVRDEIIGTPTTQRVEKAKRKVAHMNWQFKRQMPGFRNQLEKLLSQQTLAGSQYARLVYDAKLKRPVPTYIPQDDVLIPESAADFYSAERRTFVDHITQQEFESRIRDGYYVNVDSVSPPSQRPSQTAAGRATDKAEGVTRSAYNEDGLRDIYVIECLAEIENTERPKIGGDRPHSSGVESISPEGPLPYLIELDVFSRKILSCIRNWEEKDELHENLCWLVDFPFIPWRGAQSVGLIHVAGSIAGAGNGALRALLDAALVRTIPTILKLKGSGTTGGTVNLQPCGVTEIEGGVGNTDIRQTVMSVPFNEPSMMLWQLLGWTTEQGEEIVRTTFENLSSDGTPNMPVGTTLALIEQGMKVLSAIHGRLHDAMSRLIGVLHRINRMYITDDEILDDTGERLAFRADYEGPVDVVPVSDPQIFSDVQRFAQLQIIQQRADLHPELYDARKVEEKILERTKVPNAVDLLKPVPKIEELNAVNENVALVLGRPIAAFPEQDHLAHIQVLLDFGECPVLGSLPIIAPVFWPGALNHLKEHVVYWYLSHMVDMVSEATGHPIGTLTKLKDKGVKSEIDKALAAASPTVCGNAQKAFSQLPAVITKALQMLQQGQQGQQGQPDPTATAVATIEAKSKADSDASKERIAAQKTQTDTTTSASSDQAKTMQVNIEQQHEDQRTEAELQTREDIERQESATAMDIAAAKIDTGGSTNISTGTSLEGHEGPNFNKGTGDSK